MNQKITALIIDDEQDARENLQLMINEYCPSVQVVGLAATTEHARQLVDQHDPDMVFLDIMMPGQDGFGFLKSIVDRAFEVVFTTAHNEHALRAIHERAVHYLEKPINIDDLISAVKRVEELVTQHTESLITENQVNQILRNMKNRNSSEKAAIPTTDGIKLIPNIEILYLQASDAYTIVHLTGDRKIMAAKNIKSFESRLNQNIFFRAHRSYILNVEHHLTEYSRKDGYHAIMSDGNSFAISRRNLADFMDRINGF